MRLGSLTLSATLSAALLSGCSFVGGQSAQNYNPYANQYAQYGQAAAAQRCQIATPRHPIPRGCRPDQVTLGVPSQAYGAPAYAANGFPQQPQFGQPQYTSGGYGAALGQGAVAPAYTTGPRKRKPKLRGALSLGLQKSVSGEIFDPSVRGVLPPIGAYNPQDHLEDIIEGSQASGLQRTTTYTANAQNAIDVFPNGIREPGQFENAEFPSIAFNDAWSTPIEVKGGVEYILNDRNTIFANVGYTYAEGESQTAASIDATLYREVSEQAFNPDLSLNGPPVPNTTAIPNQRIAEFTYDFSNLNQLDLEVGARHYFNPLVKSEGYRTVTPFVGASIGASRVNAVDVTVSQTQALYQASFNGAEDARFDVPIAGDSTRVYDAEWLPQGQLNIGAEWQVTPGFAIAAETGLKVQLSRDYEDFVNGAGETIEGADGDTNYSIPLTLRGSVNF